MLGLTGEVDGELADLLLGPRQRLASITYADSASTVHTWDDGDRLTQVSDSLADTITRTYDDLERLKREVTPEGTVTYTYDAANGRATMTVAGQPQVVPPLAI